MPIDINKIRPEKGGDPEAVKKSQEIRFKDVGLVDEAMALDQEWRKKNFAVQQKQKELNQVQKVISEKKKASKGADSCAEELKQTEEINAELEQLKKIEADAHKLLEQKVWKLGNIVHESVPVSKNEDDNRIERTWGEPNRMTIDNTPGHYFHHAVLARIDGYDSERGQKIVGHRGYFLKGYGLLLNQALINYGLQFLMQRKYTLLQPPFFMTRSKMALTAELADFDEQLYKVSTGEEGEEGFYMIATSEQPISCMHHGEWLEEKTLPIRYGGYSSCFRKEAGAHGKDTWGIFRIHQFEKVEQFCITTPEASWEMHDEMIRIDEEFYQSLGIPYRIVAIVSGELNGAAAKKYDLEGWFPGYGTFRELVSCSNCTDFQARATETRCGIKKQNEAEKRYVHMLNATLCATERTLCCLLENYQTAEGVVVPPVLRPFMGGLEFIPYARELTKKEISQH
ncbi:hypothetical protein SteCoe_368 [Stentor coeruleus]|uniref:serine--tRNA ligase n=1 Tax=Stentor coeruleus TaxID=5963 RepID=A0A1R2D4L9_9CILI|nr:hypothetical protein SteCoe_368 [Stentor coeruleus]